MRADRLRVFFQNRGEYAQLRFAFEGAASGDHFVENASETEDVTARVGFRSLQNFRRNILKRADDRTLLRQRRRGRGQRSQIHGRRRRSEGPMAREATGYFRFRQSEVHQLGAGFGQHDVRRLQIAMDDALLMRLVQGQCRFLFRSSELDRAAARLSSRRVGESLAFEIFHDQKIGAVLRADIVKGADIRMLKRGNGPRFALHALLQFRVRGKMRRQDLDGDGAVEAGVLGAIDLAHAASAKGRNNFIGT